MPSGVRKTIKPRPITAKQAVHNSIVEEVPGTLTPLPEEHKRSEQISVKGDKLKDYSIGFEDIDAAVLYYFDNVIKPSVMENGDRVKVPVVYANPERWKSAQADGGMRDKDGKILFPVVAVKKDNIEKVRSITSKVDGNNANNFYMFEQRYTEKNRYSNFNALTNRMPVKQYGIVVVPDYYKITYSCAVYVNYVEDLNKILEAILYASDSYWGDPKRFTFMARIDNTPITQEVNTGENRKIYSQFNITLNGHVIPDSINKFMSVDSKSFSKAKVVFNTEVTSKDMPNKPKVVKGIHDNFVSFPERIIINMSTQVATYLATNKAILVAPADISSDRFYIRNTNILMAPISLPTTSKENFYIFVNGQVLYSINVLSVTQQGSDILFIVDTASIGYALKQTHQIEVIGKFA